MLYEEERQAKIMEMIQDQSRVDVQELITAFKVSESTIRRDLKELEAKQLLKRTHGGAVSLQTVNYEPTFSEKEIQNQSEKKSMALKAASFIKDGDTILLDSGTTVHYLVQELRSFQRLTIVTNALSYASELQQHSGIEVIFLGGNLRFGTLSLVGSFAEMCLDRIRVDKAFIATNGIHLKEGLTTPNISEADIKRKMIESSKEVILLADSSKFGKVSFAKFAKITDLDIIITDNQIQDSMIKGIQDIGVEICTVEASQ
jgi:DeoR family fructose operon transcriptional repressor